MVVVVVIVVVVVAVLVIEIVGVDRGYGIGTKNERFFEI